MGQSMGYAKAAVQAIVGLVYSEVHPKVTQDADGKDYHVSCFEVEEHLEGLNMRYPTPRQRSNLLAASITPRKKRKPYRR